MSRRNALIAAAGLFGTLMMTTTSAQAQTLPGGKPALDLRDWRGTIAGPATEVAVLGSTHLMAYKDFKPEWTDALLDRLAAYRPAVITIEGLSGQACDALRRYPTLYRDTYESYCTTPVEAQAATGLDVPTAYALMETMLADWPAAATPAQRRRLASVMLAAGERTSAYVQWLRLPAAERRVGDGLDAVLVKQLEGLATRANENIQIGARLAARLGLERVHAIDDHSADAVQSEDPGFEAALREVWSGVNPAAQALDGHPHASAADLLALYRMINSPKLLRAGVEADFGRALQHRSNALWGRQYAAWNEVRNLRMVGNLRAAFARTPGTRVLAIVGASHKPYFDAYLDQQSDVRIIDIEAVLK